jgi:hypothetical protein
VYAVSACHGRLEDALRTDSGKLGAHVDDHDHRHDQGQNVHEVVRSLEDECVCDLNGPRVAVCLDAGAAIDLLVAHEGAERYRGLGAYRREVAEAHRGGCARFAALLGGASRCCARVYGGEAPNNKTCSAIGAGEGATERVGASAVVSECRGQQ